MSGIEGAIAILKRAAFYLLVAVIVFIAVFPFYYAIVTSLKSGTELFEANLWPKSLSLANYTNVLTEGTFLRNLGGEFPNRSPQMPGADLRAACAGPACVQSTSNSAVTVTIAAGLRPKAP